MKDLALFHRNLRLEDNAALYNASLNQDYAGLYVFDKEYWSQSDRSKNQLKFALDSLKELEIKLNNLNVDLYVFEGSLSALKTFLHETLPNVNLHINHTTETNYHSNQLKNLSKDFPYLYSYKDFGIQIDNPDRDKWASSWQKHMNKQPYNSPKTNNNLYQLNLPKFKEFKTTLETQDMQIQTGGSDSGRELLNSFLEDRCKGYSKKMSSPSEAEYACSRLSPHIAFGTISIRDIYQTLENNINNSRYRWDLYSFKKRLHWHCHFIQKLDTQPSLEYQ